MDYNKVGYGDGYPKSNVGRFLTFILCIAGSIIVSLMTVGLTNLTSFSVVEERVYNEIKYNQIRNEYKKAASKLLVKLFSVSKDIKSQGISQKYNIQLLRLFSTLRLLAREMKNIDSQISMFGTSPVGDILQQNDKFTKTNEGLTLRWRKFTLPIADTVHTLFVHRMIDISTKQKHIENLLGSMLVDQQGLSKFLVNLNKNVTGK